MQSEILGWQNENLFSLGCKVKVSNLDADWDGEIVEILGKGYFRVKILNRFIGINEPFSVIRSWRNLAHVRQ